MILMDRKGNICRVLCEETTCNTCVCGTCRYTKHDTMGFYCCNTNSEYCTDYTEYGDSCEDWEAKNG